MNVGRIGRTGLMAATFGLLATTLALLFLASPASAQLPPLPTCSGDGVICPTPSDQASLLGVDHGLVVGSGNYGFFEYNGEGGVLRTTTFTWDACINQRKLQADRAGDSTWRPVVVLRNLNAGAHTVKLKWTEPSGAMGEVSTTFNHGSTGDVCLAPWVWNLNGNGNPDREVQKRTGSWRFTWVIDGTSIEPYGSTITPVGRGASFGATFYVVDDDCTTAVSSVPRTESQFAVRVAWDNAGSGTSHPYRVQWQAPDGTLLTVSDTFPAYSWSSRCNLVTPSATVKDSVGTWKVRAWIVENGYDFSCARDGYTTCVSPSWERTFTLYNQGPLKPPTPTQVEAGSPYRWATWNYCVASATDGDGDKLDVTFTWKTHGSKKVTGVTSGSKVCSGVWFTTLGPDTLTVTACDKFNACATSDPLTVTVINRAPAFKSGQPTISTTSTYRGASITGTGDAIDPDADPYKCVFDWSAATTESGSVNSGSACSTSYAYGALGTYTVRAWVTDGLTDGTSPAHTFPTAITIYNREPNVPNAPRSADATLYLNTSHRFIVDGPSDPDTNYDQIQCTFFWGDGTSTPTGWLNQPASTCEASHTYNRPGTYSAYVRVTDSIGAYKESSLKSFTINNRAPTYVANSGSISATEIGRYGSVTARATGQDSDNDNIWCKFEWGDGGSNVVGPVGNRVECSASHQYGSTTGSYAVTVRFKDAWMTDFGGATSLGSVNVVNLAPNPPAPDCPTYPIAHKSAVTCRFTLSDPDVDDRTSAVINWGDGKTDSIPLGANGRIEELTHYYAAPGEYDIRYTVTDSFVPSKSTESRWFRHQSTNTGPTPVTVACSPLGDQPRGVTVTCRMAATDPESDNVRFVVNWGDGISQTTGFVAPGAEAVASHEYSYAASSVGKTYSITVTAQDSWDTGGSASGGSIHIINRAPSKPTGSASPNPAYRHESVTLTTSSTDADKDTIRYFVDWGDGSPTTSTGYYASGTSVSLTHEYTTLGLKCIRVTAVDSVDASMPSVQSDCINVDVQNKKPVAVISASNPTAGDNVWLSMNQVSMSAANSRDDDGDGICAYEWVLYVGPSSGGQEYPDSRRTTRDVAYSLPSGTYTAQLKVKDCRDLWSDPSEFTFFVV